MRSPFDAMRSIIYYLIQVIYVGFFCYFGHEVTVGFETVYDSIYQCSWDEFPVEIQKIQAVMIMNAQKPVYIQGFMNTKCSREMFKKVYKEWMIENIIKMRTLSFYRLLTQHSPTFQCYEVWLDFYSKFLIEQFSPY